MNFTLSACTFHRRQVQIQGDSPESITYEYIYLFLRLRILQIRPICFYF